MATPGRKTGFDCEFVEKPPVKFIQSECPVCLQILREPYQAPCCGKSFCQGCIGRIQADNKPCPTCNKENFSTFHNKGLQCSLYEFEVYCSHKKEGCDWKGELGQLDNHLNLSPQPDKQLEGCKYSEIECIYCTELIKCCNITIHQGDHCDKRPFSCEYCHNYESHYEDVIHNHWPVCGYHPVHCPNECGKLPQRQALENHIAEDCPKTLTDCDFRHVGCDVRLLRKDIPAHLNESLVTHTSLQAASYSKLLASHTTLLASHSGLQDKVRRLEHENETLKQGSMAILGYVEITMQNFGQYKKDDDSWFSPPFYTHPGGYKFCFNVDANGSGDGEGTHLSVYIYLMRGEFDDHLQFPFRGNITVQLVDQEGGEEHITETINLTDQTTDDIAGRVTEGEMQEDGWGHPQFISLDELKPKYVKNDSLRFRITEIKIWI